MKTQIVQKNDVLERMYGKTRGGILSGLTASKSNIVFFLLSFLLGRVSLFGGLMPFGLAFYAAAITSNANRLVTAAAVVIGMATGGARKELYTALSFMVLFTVLSKLLKNSTEKEDLKHSVMGLICVAVPQIILVGLQGFLMYDALMSLFNSVLIFSMIYIFRRAVPLIEGIKKKRALTNEEMISVAMIAAVSLSGLGGINIFGASLLNVLGIFAVLLLTFGAGPGVGAAVGVIVGLVINLSSPATPVVIGSYAFCGLMAGLFRNLGKTGTAVGFVLANAVLTLYINGSTEVLIHIKDIIPAALMFVVVPKKIMEEVLGSFALEATDSNDKASYSQRLKELTVERLSNFAKAFQELSKTFSEISQTKMVTNKQDISSLFDRVADKVCKDCSLCLHCWDRNFYNTYQVMFKIVENLERKGWIDESDIPDYFMERCERIGEFVRQVNSVYELFKVDMVWKNRVGESRGLISQQLDGLSKVIANLAVEIDSEVKFRTDMEDALLSELGNRGIKAHDVVVYENKWGKYEVTIFHKGCAGANKCLDFIEELASSVMGKRMIRDKNECMHNHRTGICNLKLVEEEVFKITTGMARSSKYENQISGDSYSFMNTGAGKYILALSDGMGTGQAASSQSKVAISLLEQFMETGFDQDTAIKLINSILVLKSDDDSFATIDLSAVDLYDGKIEFVKIGAAPTFIKRQDRVEVVRTVSLPAGILSNIETELVCKNADNGDFIIMVTDGIVDSFKLEEGGEQNLIKFIEGIDSINPQVIADLILAEAHSKCTNKPVDDMTVLVAKVWKR
ncbi:MAG TPA: stage II sporulation protein E [Acetivibrio sp.]|uniref:stage II sporulation protein E n=1 Tax=Acetivibrio sp. TaxID=1872092 RepID=UPI002CEB811F|nr:stage II sporulation protein E [Acetivibrio sp.]HOM03364.1 stage II sporulation protein E [Acetivibrio sp.]